MSLLAYAILGLLVERCREDLARGQEPGGYPLSVIWQRMDEAASFREIQTVLDALVDAGHIERDGQFTYRFCVTRIALTQTA